MVSEGSTCTHVMVGPCSVMSLTAAVSSVGLLLCYHGDTFCVAIVTLGRGLGTVVVLWVVTPVLVS